MQRMRDVLRGSLGRALGSLSDEDRLVAAWPVACGPVLAARAEVRELDAERVLHVRVLETGWREQFFQMRTKLTEDLRQITGVRVQAIHFEGQDTNRGSGRDIGATAARVRPARVSRRKSMETNR